MPNGMFDGVSEEEMIEKINRVLEEKGEDWVVVAMVDGSVGYHTPEHARSLIRWFKEGHRVSGCERCLACYGGSLVKMIYADILRFEWYEERYPEKAKALMEHVLAVEKLDSASQTQFGLMYPTML